MILLHLTTTHKCKRYLAVTQSIFFRLKFKLRFFSIESPPSIVHDPAGDDWTNERPFYEGEKVSHAIQMWWYTLQGLRNDLWSTSPPKMAKKVLGSVFDQSLSILVAR